MVPSADGLSLVPYTGDDRDSLTINGELSKLGWNITTGHGIHAGIHFRSSSYWSLLLGEQVGIERLAGSGQTVTTSRSPIKITKFDGTTATISNQAPTNLHGPPVRTTRLGGPFLLSVRSPQIVRPSISIPVSYLFCRQEAGCVVCSPWY